MFSLKKHWRKCALFFGVHKGGPYHFSKVGASARYFAIRKIFGCKKIPKKILKKAETIPNSFSTEEFERASANCLIPGIDFHLIGIKEDTTIIMGNYTQEGL